MENLGNRQIIVKVMTLKEGQKFRIDQFCERILVNKLLQIFSGKMQMEAMNNGKILSLFPFFRLLVLYFLVLSCSPFKERLNLGNIPNGKTKKIALPKDCQKMVYEPPCFASPLAIEEFFLQKKVDLQT